MRREADHEERIQKEAAGVIFHVIKFLRKFVLYVVYVVNCTEFAWREREANTEHLNQKAVIGARFGCLPIER
jgi:hypothetical protein